MAGSGISIIIPVLDDGAALGALLGRIRAWPDQPGEILVVSGGASSQAEALCADRQCVYMEDTPCRGAQLDRGARAAAGAVLWFLHADAEPLPSSLAAIA